MENPWKNVPPQAPYVLDMDRASIERYNAGAAGAARIHSELLPEPYLGNPKAPVVLLSLNPGYNRADVDFYSQHEAACRLNLEHSPQDYPFYLLNPAYAGYTGHDWWKAKLKFLITDCGLSAVAGNVCCIEYFPYHSPKFGADRLNLGSNPYRNALVQAAIAENRLIVIMRSKRLWLNAIPELKDYTGCCELRNPQQVYVSPGNLPSDWYARLVDAVK